HKTSRRISLQEKWEQRGETGGWGRGEPFNRHFMKAVRQSTPCSRFPSSTHIDSPPVPALPSSVAMHRQTARRQALFVNWTLRLVALAVLWSFPLSSAQAAPIGMCSEAAESIAAPPPVLPASDATARDCSQDEVQEFGKRVPSGPVEHLSELVSVSKLQCVITSQVGRLRAGAVTLSIEKADCLAADEHRSRGLRPPTA